MINFFGENLEKEDLLKLIGNAKYLCKPISWISKCGIVSPYFYKKEGSDFLRTFTGGLLTTCGLTQAGTPCIDNGIIIEEKLGLHGRISHIPAEKININEY